MGRGVLTLALAWLGARAFRHEYGHIPLLSDINLAIHEFGHILFSAFGETLTVLGGSLTQIALPLVFAGYFLWSRAERRDPHAASVCAWWAVMNLLSVAIYAADAQAGRLMLITGETGADGAPHDWYYLFAHWGVLTRDTVIAGHMRRVAWLGFVVTIVWGLVAAWRSGERERHAAVSAPERAGLADR